MYSGLASYQCPCLSWHPLSHLSMEFLGLICIEGYIDYTFPAGQSQNTSFQITKRRIRILTSRYSKYFTFDDLYEYVMPVLAKDKGKEKREKRSSLRYYKVGFGGAESRVDAIPFED
jgi:hypothetical protein